MSHGSALSLPEPVQALLTSIEAQDLAGLPHTERRARIRGLSDESFRRFSRPGPALTQVTEHVVGTSDAPVRVRLYYPDEADRFADQPPVHVHLHGGGWWLGSIDELVNDAACRFLATSGVAVAAVDYRLAPEHPFPAAHHDVLATLRWLHQSTDLGLDGTSLSLGGNSAGATLAAAAALAAPQLDLPPLVFQLLEVPVLDLAPGIGLTGSIAELLGMYLPDLELANDAEVSPLQAPDLRSLPPTCVYAAEHDLLRPQAEQWVRRLTEAGVPAHLEIGWGATHEAPLLTRSWEPARRWQDACVARLRHAHLAHACRLSEPVSA